MNHLILSLLIVIFTYFIIKVYNFITHFRKWGIPQPLEIPFVGLVFDTLIVGTNIGVVYKNLYNSYKEAKYVGFHMFNKPVIMVRDEELIKSILVKNFDSFSHKTVFFNENVDPLFGKNLAFTNGEKWRELRTTLSPSFTSSKMKTMFVLMSDCAENFADQFVELYSDKNEINMKDAFTKYANDVVATCAFGIEIDSLKDPNNTFYTIGRKTFDFQSFSRITIFFLLFFPKISQKLSVRFIPKEYSNYFIDVIKNTIKTRKDNGIVRPDMLQLMMEARDVTSDDDLIDITAQAFIFFLGGFETTSSHMCLMAHVLAEHQDVQDKLRSEIDAVLQENNGKITYETIKNMSYLDAVFNETMRKYPIAYVNRECSKDFELPPALPDAKPYTVRVGDEILIPVPGIHADPQYHENPEVFDPSRYLDKKSTASDITNLGFGMGPRMCIGNRFAILETKVLFIHLLAKCSFNLCDKSPVPFVADRLSYVPAAKNGFWYKIKARK